MSKVWVLSSLQPFGNGLREPQGPKDIVRGRTNNFGEQKEEQQPRQQSDKSNLNCNWRKHIRPALILLKIKGWRRGMYSGLQNNSIIKVMLACMTFVPYSVNRRRKEDSAMPGFKIYH